MIDRNVHRSTLHGTQGVSTRVREQGALVRLITIRQASLTDASRDPICEMTKRRHHIGTISVDVVACVQSLL